MTQILAFPKTASRPTVTIEVRSVYGNEMVYPVCDAAKRFAAIAGTKTLSRDVLRQIDALGFAIDQQVKPLSFGR